MTKKFIFSALAGVALGFATTANAALYYDLDVFSSSQGYVSVGDSLTGTFDITGPGLGKGFTPDGSEDVDWAFFEFTLLDERDPTGAKMETWHIEVGAADIADAPGSNEFASGGSLIIGRFVFGFGNLAIEADIQADGKVAYEISASSGDFRVINGLMKVGTVTGSNNRVPDGGMTLALLGSGILGLCALRRRF